MVQRSCMRLTVRAMLSVAQDERWRRPLRSGRSWMNLRERFRRRPAREQSPDRRSSRHSHPEFRARLEVAREPQSRIGGVIARLPLTIALMRIRGTSMALASGISAHGKRFETSLPAALRRGGAGAKSAMAPILNGSRRSQRRMHHRPATGEIPLIGHSERTAVANAMNK